MEKYREVLDLDVSTKAGVTPLMLAVKRNNSKVVKALLNESANPFTKDQLGQEAIDYRVATKDQEGETPINKMIHTAKQQWLTQLSAEKI